MEVENLNDKVSGVNQIPRQFEPFPVNFPESLYEFFLQPTDDNLNAVDSTLWDQMIELQPWHDELVVVADHYLDRKDDWRRNMPTEDELFRIYNNLTEPSQHNRDLPLPQQWFELPEEVSFLTNHGLSRYRIPNSVWQFALSQLLPLRSISMIMRIIETKDCSDLVTSEVFLIQEFLNQWKKNLIITHSGNEPSKMPETDIIKISVAFARNRLDLKQKNPESCFYSTNDYISDEPLIETTNTWVCCGEFLQIAAYDLTEEDLILDLLEN